MKLHYRQHNLFTIPPTSEVSLTHLCQTKVKFQRALLLGSWWEIHYSLSVEDVSKQK